VEKAPFFASFEPGQGKGNTVYGTVALTNGGATPRWFALSTSLDTALEEAFDAQLVQLCSFKHAPDLYYVQGLGLQTGFVAFLLGPNVTLSLDRFAFRTYGDDPTLHVWELNGIHAGDQPIEALFSALETLGKSVEVTDAFARVTEGTHEQKPCAVRLDVVGRWSVNAAS
jgi:hypothetical protein